MRVLLADDSDLILERLQEMLSVYKELEIVGILKLGTETLEALRNLKPDLAIIDFRMPGLNGLEVVSEIRKDDKNVKIIMLTLYTTCYLKHLALQVGVDYFFSKVDDFDKLKSVVSEMAVKNGIETCI
jgi:DNA-binding NarL/FixJ family response regulator